MNRLYLLLLCANRRWTRPILSYTLTQPRRLNRCLWLTSQLFPISILIFLTELTALWSLHIGIFGRSLSLIVSELAAARISLERLNLYNFECDREFVSAIIKIRRMKALTFQRVRNMKPSDIVEIVFNLEELIPLALNHVCEGEFGPNYTGRNSVIFWWI